MQQDYTLQAIEYINTIIKNGKKVGKPRDFSKIERHDHDMFITLHGALPTLVAASIKPPKEIYLGFMEEEVLSDPVFAWALWWAKEKLIVKHFGPAGTKGWALFRADPIAADDVYMGQYSPFNPSSMMQYMDHILKYSALVDAKTMERHREAEQSIEKIRNELESEKQHARIQSRMVWS